MRKSVHIGIAMILVGYWSVVSVDRGLTETLPPEPWVMPFDIPTSTSSVTQKDIYEMMWLTFIALNWPHKDGGSRGEPDTEKSLAPWNGNPTSEGPVVWETYRRPDQVFLPPREWPISWDDDLPSNVCFPGSGSKIKVITVNDTNYSEFADGINQPFTQAHYPTGPVLDQNKNYLRYEVTMNQSYFSYIKFFRYYRPETQIRAVRAYIDFTEKHGEAPPIKDWQSGRSARFFQPLPNGKETYLTRVFKLPPYALQGIVEIKATWKVLEGEDVPGRFYRREVFFLNPDGECTGPHTVGLIALHIHRVIPFGTVRDFEHIGTTFEQVDNVRLSDEGGPFPPHLQLPPHPSLNPGTLENPVDYLNGYQVNGVSGRSGLIPAPLPDGKPLPDKSERPMTNISRQVPVPADVEEVNAKFRGILKDLQTVLFFYKMIGTSNPNLNNPPNPPNPYLGPGITGAQSSNGQNLINTALESYTQEGWSCQRCHLNAFPQGVSLPLPSFEQKFKALHVISFLLLNAQSDHRRPAREGGKHSTLNPIFGKGHHKK